MNLLCDRYKKLIVALMIALALSISFSYIVQQTEALQDGESFSKENDRAIKGEYIIKFKKDSKESSKRAITEYGGKISGELEKIKAVKIEVNEKDKNNFLKKAREDDRVAWIEPNYIIEVEMIPNDYHWSTQWGPEKIGAESAWDLEQGDGNVLVVVIDTGVYYNHPDLAPNYIAGGYDWVNEDDEPLDDHGHGTHCAGIIAALINNEAGIAGLAQVRVMAEKFLSSSGQGTTWDAAQAIIHAVDFGKTISDQIILSNSWGSYGSSSILAGAMQYAYENEALIVGAAGNSASNAPHYPSAYPEVISVSATDSNDQLAEFSNYGSTIELSAPGVSIHSTYLNDGYKYMSGTSMACPHVSGVAALVWSRFPEKSREQIRIILQTSAEDFGDHGWDQYYGYGRVNAFQALQGSKLHDLRVLEIITPPLIFIGSTITIKSTIQNIGTNVEPNIIVQFLVNDAPIDTRSISEIQVTASIDIEFDWTPISEGPYNVTVYALPVDGEDSVYNNWISRTISAQERGKILIVSDDDGSYSRSSTSIDEFSTALTTHGYDFNSWYESTHGKPSIDVLSNFRLVIWTCAGHWGWAIDPTDAETLIQYLSDGGSILLEGEDIAFDHRSDNFMTQVAHATYKVDSSGADGLTVVDPSHPICKNIPSTFGWAEDPSWEDGTAPANGGNEILRYRETSHSAVITSGSGGSSSTVYISFPIAYLEEHIKEEIIINSVEWLLSSYIVSVEVDNPDLMGLKVYLNKISYEAPASISLVEGPYSLTTWPSWYIGSLKYYFDCWKDESGEIISNEILFTHSVQGNETIYVCFKELAPGCIDISISDIGTITAGEEVELNVTVANNGPGPVSDMLIKLIYPSNAEIREYEEESINLESISPSGSNTITWHITASESGTLRLIVTVNGRSEDGSSCIDIMRLKTDVVE